MPAVASRGRGRRTINEINMVPFIDVMLVLLIIFMVTAPLITPSVINLPTVAKGSNPPQQVIHVTINKDESIGVMIGSRKDSVTLAELPGLVKDAQQGHDEGSSAVVIDADKNVKYDSVMKALNALRSNGVQRVGLSVQDAK